MQKLRESGEYYLQAKGRTDDRDLAKKLASYAANAFVHCGEFSKAGELFKEIKNFRYSGECFKRAKKYENAVLAFEAADIFFIYNL